MRMPLYGVSTWSKRIPRSRPGNRNLFYFHGSYYENSKYRPLHETSPNAVQLDAGERIPALRNVQTTVSPPSSPRRTSRTIHLTAAGEAQAARVTAAKIHLEDVREAARQRSNHSESSHAINTVPPSVDPKENNMLAHPGQIPEDSIFSCVLPSLELAFMSIRSSECRNPSNPGYDLAAPPYNYNEAMRRPDHAAWQATIDKELDMFVSMKIF